MGKTIKATQPPRRLNPAALGATITEHYHNRSLADVNDHEIRLSVMTEGFPWHIHPDSDETFLVVEGQLVIEFEAGEVVLSPGEMLTVPHGARHRTRPGGARSVNLTFARKDAATAFEAGG
ncbi:cupin domain-containing protein [Sphingosinicella sp. LHD-64]|uniref:cupin domain-containing protein n=1 Tax=Sphingosinicella sp. LHD-64 TaxID=3072139 RepID=UPI0028106E6F|nr:cupin domain-containing protein [Sphingosinicella sp. LHD-64]MDQ8757938.1 cupin domain-containing protein [Sphingosinicella sp. LHD-64]